MNRVRPITKKVIAEDALMEHQVNELIAAATDQLYKNAYSEALDDILSSMKKGVRKHDTIPGFIKFMAGEIKTLREICSASSLTSQ